MQGGGDAHGHDLLQHRPRHAQRPQLQTDAALGAQQHPHRQQGGHRLGDDGGVGHALYAHAELQHEQQVKSGIQHGGHQQEVEGTPGVAHRPEDAGAHVVDQQSHDAGKVDGQVGGLLRRHLRRGLHQAQHQGRHENAGCGEHDAQQERQHHGGVHRLPHLFLPLGAVILADDHARAAGQPQKEADQHVDDGRDGAHGGECLVADEVAHHPCVHHVVQLLEQVAHHQGQGKVDEMLRDAALCHVHVIAGRAVVGMERQMQMSGMAHGGVYSLCYHRLTRADTVLTGRNAPHLPAMGFRVILGF